MDVIRSAYVVDWQFGDDPLTAARVQWWFPPEGTPFYPHPTVFYSLNWSDEDERENRSVGEQWPGNRTYSKGETINGYKYGPPCGTEEQFQEGTTPDTPTPDRNPDGVPDCCYLCQPYSNDTVPQLQTPADPFRDPDINDFPFTSHFWCLDVDCFIQFRLIGSGFACETDFASCQLNFTDFTADPVYDVILRLVSYDKTSFTGEYLMPDDSTQFPGQLIEVRFPGLLP